MSELRKLSPTAANRVQQTLDRFTDRVTPGELYSALGDSDEELAGILNAVGASAERSATLETIKGIVHEMSHANVRHPPPYYRFRFSEAVQVERLFGHVVRTEFKKVEIEDVMDAFRRLAEPGFSGEMKIQPLLRHRSNWNHHYPSPKVECKFSTPEEFLNWYHLEGRAML